MLDGVSEWIKGIPESDARYQKIISRMKIYDGSKNEGPSIF